MINRKARYAPVVLAGALALCGAAVSAQEAEDDSAEFQSDLDRIAAEQGVPDAAATVTTKDGLTSAVAGVSAMRMLVVRQNEDGTFTYGHAATDEEVDAFVESDSTSPAAEE